jgi:hypothetical protein
MEQMQGRDPKQAEADAHKDFLETLATNLTVELDDTAVEASMKELLCCLQFSYIMDSQPL